MNKELKESYIRLLRDRHRELCDKMQEFRKLSSYLSFELEHFDYELKAARKEFTKDELKGIWELVPHPEHCPFEKLKTIETDLNDEMVPIFSEAYLYETIGKEDARTVLALLNRIYESAGKVGGF
jgi:hypothetical protein